MASISYIGVVSTLLGFSVGSTDYTTTSVRYYRNSSGPKASIRAAEGCEITILDGTAYAPLLAANITSRNGTTATEILAHKTYTSATSLEYQRTGYDAASGLYDVGVDYVGTAGGTNYGKRIGSVNAAGTFTGITVNTNGAASISAAVSGQAYGVNVGTGIGAGPDYNYLQMTNPWGVTGLKIWGGRLGIYGTGHGLVASKAFVVDYDGYFGIATGSAYTASADVSLKRYAATSAWNAQADGGVRVRNLADSADAPLSASTGTFSGQISLNGYAKIGGVSAGVAGVYAADGTTLGTVAAGSIDFGTYSGVGRILSTDGYSITASTFAATSLIVKSGANQFCDLQGNNLNRFAGNIGITFAGDSGSFASGNRVSINSDVTGILRVTTGSAKTTLTTLHASEFTNGTTAQTTIGNPTGGVAIPGLLETRNGTTATEILVHNTYTSSTSFETLRVKANTGAAYQIGSAIGSAGGTARNVEFGHWDSAGTFSAGIRVNTTGILSAYNDVIISNSKALRFAHVTSKSTPAIKFEWGGGGTTGIWGNNSEIGFVMQSFTKHYFTQDQYRMRSGGAMGWCAAGNDANALTFDTRLQRVAAGAAGVYGSDGTTLGYLSIADPTAATHAATKQYVDTSRMYSTEQYASTASYNYFGFTTVDGFWKVNRFDVTTGAKTTAQDSNNGPGTYADLTEAWVDYLTLVYT